MSGDPSSSSQPSLPPSTNRTRPVSSADCETNSPSGWHVKSTSALLYRAPSENQRPSLRVFASGLTTDVYSVFTWLCENSCSLLMSTHTSPARKQIRPVSGYASECNQRRND